MGRNLGRQFRRVGALLATALLLNSCAGSGLFTAAPDRSKWSTHTIHLANWRLKFNAPDGYEMEKWDHLWSKDMDLDLNRELERWQSAQAFNAAWEYHGFLTEGLMGTLRMTVWLLGRIEGDLHNLLRLNELEEYRRVLERKEWDPVNEKNLRSGHRELLVEVPKLYQRVVISGREWLRFKYSGHENYYGYTIGLREDRSLVVKFAFIDNTGGKKRQDWRSDAEQLREEIVSTIRLEEMPKPALSPTMSEK